MSQFEPGKSNKANKNLPHASKALRNYKIPEKSMELHEPVSPQEQNWYRSASVLLRAISEEAVLWQQNLPENYRPAILAVLQGGIQIQVETLAQISFHGVRVTGTLNGGPCSMLAHQSSIQLLCFGEEVVENKPKNPIGFIWDGQKVEV